MKTPLAAIKEPLNERQIIVFSMKRNENTGKILNLMLLNMQKSEFNSS
jgi:hypothetical protein